MSDYADNLLAGLLILANKVAGPGMYAGSLVSDSLCRLENDSRDLLEALDAWDRLGPVKVEEQENNR